jgi:hypothetical protein
MPVAARSGERCASRGILSHYHRHWATTEARSFELRAAFALAKLYQSTNRAGDAHDILAPALDRFVPMPEFPEIVTLLRRFIQRQLEYGVRLNLRSTDCSSKGSRRAI